MAPKPKPARFVFTVGMALAMALTILTITADRDLAAPSSSAVYHPQPSTFAFVLRGPQAARRIERRARRAHATPMIAPEDSSAPSVALLRSSERCRFDQSRKRPDPPCECASTTGRGICHDEGGGAPIRGRDAQIGRPKNDRCRH